MRNVIKALIRPRDNKLASRIVSAGFWVTASRVVLRASLVIRTVILARLLAPDDFGLMAIATLAVVLLERFTQGGFDAALIQRTDDIAPYLNTAWTLQIVRALTMAGILAFAAPWIAQFFGAPEATDIMRVLSVAVAIRGFANIAVVTFVKELRFGKYFVLVTSSRGVETVVSIGAALVFRNVWALVLGVLSGAAGYVIVSYLIDSYRPRIQWVWEQVKQLFDFGKWILASSILSFFSANLDDILVGRILGVQSLGWYRMAYNFSQAIATEVTQITSQVAFPTYSKLQSAAGRLRVAYMSTVHLVAFLGFPIAIGTILVADDLTYGVLGDQWAPIVVPMRILSVAGLIRGVSATAGPLFQSQGRPNLPARFVLTNVVIVAALLYPAIDRFGLSGAAAVVVVGQALTGLPALGLALSMGHASRLEVKQAVWFPALNTGLMATVVVAVQLVFFEEPSFLSLIVLVGTGTLVYLAAIALSTKIFGYVAPTDLLNRVRRAAA